MTFVRIHTFALACLLATACGSGTSSFRTPGESATAGPSGTSTAPVTNGTQVAPVTGGNVMALSVNGSLCSTANSQGYPNKPCVQVTLCDPNGGNCQTITDVLLDTGSSGLRVFSSVLNAGLLQALTPATSGGNAVAECTSFGDGTSDWGPVEIGTVGLGSEPLVKTQIQVINSSYSNSSSYCQGADTTPAGAGFNAILGVGLFASDCGPSCASSANNQNYFSCSGNTCNGVAVAEAQQVTNPATLLPQDNNGVIIKLPSVALGGTPSVAGFVVLGIGTQSNNQPAAGVRAYAVDPDQGVFTTSFQGTTYASSFLDTGSSGMYFKPPSSVAAQLPDCGSTQSDASGWDCPTTTETYAANNSGYTGSPTGVSQFAVGNFVTLFGNSSNNVFSEIAGSLDDGGQAFDWGLPFFLGRNVYVGFEKTSSGLGSGTYWAY